MYPYNAQLPQSQPAGMVQNTPQAFNNVAVATPGQSYPVAPGNTGNNPWWMNKLQNRLKLSHTTVTVVPSVLACILVQAVAAFFIVTTTLTFLGAVQNADDFSDDPSHDGHVLYIVFSVFSALASAMCAPMIQNSGYTQVIMSGTVLLLFSTLSSSQVTSAEILVIPYSIFGACAYGLLITGPQVAMLDFLNNRRALATSLSYLGVTIGQLAGSMSFAFTDMRDDANYDGSGAPRWPNNMRIIEVTAVIALISATVMRKPSFNTGNWPELFHYAPFYVLCVLNFFVGIGFDLLNAVYSNLPDDRDFRTHPKGAHTIFTVSFISQLIEFVAVLAILVLSGVCCKAGGFKRITLISSAIFVAIVAAGSYINKLTYEEFETFVIFAGVAGFVKALVRVCLPMAMISYTGRQNYKIGLPFLDTAGGLGALVSYLVQDGADIPDDEPIETGWFIAAAAFSIFAVIALFAHCRYSSWEAYVADNAEDPHEAHRVSEIENAVFMPDEIIGLQD